ncbi:MAG: UDP-N-acetylmuramoylalanyl-D-glutamyl-2,6-diaminopimelate--D-alanyl-D-alanine ligase [Alphaproteobacteria bacterium]|nr:UDP-N-acetylmuramoylalanyl-D-glutamyl-2,6-diaminopimelate--D-alanyl-D-alanine ligase [Alphaproteobacteria bacterium]
MMSPLWAAADAAAATGGSCSTDWVATGVSIDTRTLEPGDLFVGLQGPNHDGHDYVAAAMQRGAAAAMVDREIPRLANSAPLLRVTDTLSGLAALGAAGRRRSAARIIAVTGSVGKTGTKEALRLGLAPSGPTYASAGGLNNHWGAPLSLARLPPDTRYGVFELGMNHPGEIAALTRLVRPHVAVVTTVEPAHLGFFSSVEAIADAKAEIFLGLELGGSVVLNRDNPHYTRLARAAKRAGAVEILGFGVHPEAAARLNDCVLDSRGSTVEAIIGDRLVRFRMAVPGRHWVMNALAVLAAVQAAGGDVVHAAEALGEFEALPGRGRRHELAWRGGTLTLIDESYNASPAAMRAALAVLAATEPGDGGRRVALLGDMLELGEASERLHRELAESLAAGIDRVFLIGEAIVALDEALPAAKRGGLWRSVEEAMPALLSFLEPGDVVTVKGSRGVGLGRVVELLCAQSLRHAACRPET